MKSIIFKARSLKLIRFQTNNRQSVIHFFFESVLILHHWRSSNEFKATSQKNTHEC